MAARLLGQRSPVVRERVMRRRWSRRRAIPVREIVAMESKAPYTTAFCSIHRLVSQMNECVDILAVVRKYADSDARAQPEHVFTDSRRACQGRD